MVRALSLPALWLLLVFLTGCGGCASKVDLLRVVTSGRDGWQQPERVIAALDIRPGQRVAEIGAGDGYWLPALSEAVGPDGIVYAVEVEPDKVASLRERIARDRLANVDVILGRYDDPLLPDGGVDLAITCLTYHHIEDRARYFEKLRRDLAPAGRVAHLDDRDDLAPPLRWLPTRGHTQNVAEMDAEMATAGYRRSAAFDFLLLQVFHIYSPDAGAAEARIVSAPAGEVR